MKKNYNFDVLVVGASHINALGVIRSLGERGINPYLLLVGNKHGYIKKSKYLKKVYHVNNNEDIVNMMLNKISYEKNRCYVIPTGDPVALTIDQNFEKLEKKYILPNINKKSNEISKYMDKYEQFKLAKENKYKMAETLLIDLKKEEIENNIYPCILKPAVSADGEKADIRICYKEKEFTNAIEEFKNKKYKQVLLQEYIEYDYEIDVPGISNAKESIAYAMIEKINIYPVKRGSTCYGKVVDVYEKEKTKLENLMNSIKYNGIFDIDLFVKDNEIYLNEINFRNGALSYSLTNANISISLEWILLNENECIDKKRINKPYFFMVEDYNFRLVLQREISFLKFIKEFVNTKVFSYISFRDPKPLIYKFIYVLKKQK